MRLKLLGPEIKCIYKKQELLQTLGFSPKLNLVGFMVLKVPKFTKQLGVLIKKSGSCADCHMPARPPWDFRRGRP